MKSEKEVRCLRGTEDLDETPWLTKFFLVFAVISFIALALLLLYVMIR